MWTVFISHYLHLLAIAFVSLLLTCLYVLASIGAVVIFGLVWGAALRLMPLRLAVSLDRI